MLHELFPNLEKKHLSSEEFKVLIRRGRRRRMPATAQGRNRPSANSICVNAVICRSAGSSGSPPEKRGRPPRALHNSLCLSDFFSLVGAGKNRMCCAGHSFRFVAESIWPYKIPLAFTPGDVENFGLLAAPQSTPSFSSDH